MSLHAQLSPEAIRALKAQNRNSRATSIVIAAATITLAGLILALLGLDSFELRTKPPEYSFHTTVKDPPVKPETTTSFRSTSNPAPAAPNRFLVARMPSDLSLPQPDFVSPTINPSSGSTEGAGIGGDGVDWEPEGEDGIPTPPLQRCSKSERLARLQERGGTAAIDEAVANTLRWLKRAQNEDGSWGEKHKVGMTGLTLLAYLGRCETPVSLEFGESCTLGVVYLLDLAAKNEGRMATNLNDKHWPYEHAIATYALAEALSFAPLHGYNIPGHRQAVQEAGQWIIDHQHPSGGWDYNYDKTSGRGGDLSIAGWHLQALKACQLTGVEFRNLKSCIKKGLEYVERMQGATGGFGYTGPPGASQAHPPLTGVGTLSLQIWGKEARSSTRKGIDSLRKRPAFAFDSEWADLYAHYYASQALLRAGGRDWTAYNKTFAPELLSAQKDDGSFPKPGAGGKLQAAAPLYASDSKDGLVYRNALCALMLEVYYRYLPATGG